MQSAITSRALGMGGVGDAHRDAGVGDARFAQLYVIHHRRAVTLHVRSSRAAGATTCEQQLSRVARARAAVPSRVARAHAAQRLMHGE